MKKIKTSLNKIIKTNVLVLNYIKEFIITICNQPKFYIPVIFFCTLTYGFNLFNETVSTDDLAGDYYIGSGFAMFKGFRWAMVIWGRVFTMVEFSPFIPKFIALIFLVLSSIVIAAILYKNTNNNNVWFYTIFSCMYITYSLNNEIWEYSGACICIYGGILLSAYSILYLMECQRVEIVDIAFTGFLLSFASGGYESSILVYITLVAIVLFLNKVIIKKNNYKWFNDSVKYALSFFVSVLLKYLIGFMFIKLLNLGYQENGDTGINWIYYGMKDCMKIILNGNFKLYIVNALTYKPITLFMLSTIVFIFILVIKCKSFDDYLLGTLTYLSIFSLSFVKGSALMYRTSQTVQLFVSVVAFLSVYLTYKNIKTYRTVLMLILFVIYGQGKYYHQLLALNHLRSENELSVVRNIGSEIYRKYGKNKTVVFVGAYDLGKYIKNQITLNNLRYSPLNSLLIKVYKDDEYYRNKIIETNVNSLLNWSEMTFFNNYSQELMEKLFSYCGYEIDTIDENVFSVIEQCQKKALEKDMKPFEIYDNGDYLIVNLG